MEKPTENADVLLVEVLADVTVLETTQTFEPSRAVATVEKPKTDTEQIRAERCANFAATAIICAGCPMLQYCGSKAEGLAGTVIQVMTVEPSLDGAPDEDINNNIPTVDIDSAFIPEIEKKAPAESFSKDLRPEKATLPNSPYLALLLDDNIEFVSAQFPEIQTQAIDDRTSVTVESSGVEFGRSAGQESIPVAVAVESESPEFGTEILSVVHIQKRAVVDVVKPERVDVPEMQAIETETLPIQPVAADRVLVLDSVLTTVIENPIVALEATDEMPVAVTVDVLVSVEHKDITDAVSQIHETVQVTQAEVVPLLQIMRVGSIEAEQIEIQVIEESTAIEDKTVLIDTVVAESETVLPALEFQQMVANEIVVQLGAVGPDVPIIGGTDEVNTDTVESLIDESVVQIHIGSDAPELWLQQLPSQSTDHTVVLRHRNQFLAAIVLGEQSDVTEKPLIDSNDSVDPEFKLSGLGKTHVLTTQIVRHLAMQALRSLLFNLSNKRVVIR